MVALQSGVVTRWGIDLIAGLWRLVQSVAGSIEDNPQAH
jgi:hypothetical protein